MNKLIVCIMGQNCEKFIGMCLESVKNADAIVYCDGGSQDKTFDYLFKEDFDWAKNNGKKRIILNRYDKEDKAMNGKQRNFYLNYLKANYPNDWAICLDADEVVQNLDNIKQFIQTSPKGLYSVKMRHFIGSLGFEDNTQQTHYALNRLFKISEAGGYPEVEHPVLTAAIGGAYYETQCTTIWHLAYLQGVSDIKKKYENHMKKSNMHTPEYLDNWKDAHLLGKYPIKQVDIMEIPDIILKHFNISKDKYYFQGRNLELKHFIMVKSWIDYFKPRYVIEFGSGKAPFGFAFKYNNISYLGIELSQFAVSNAMAESVQGDILNYRGDIGDLIMAFDVLEHLDYKDLDMALETLKRATSKYVLFSIPYIGDSNLEADKTHKIKETKEWWVNKLSQYFKIKDVPKEWLFNHQILIGEK